MLRDHRLLAVGGGIADVFLVRADDGRKAGLQGRHDPGSVIHGQGGLGDILGSVLGGLTGGQSQQAPNAQNSGFAGGGKSLLIAVLPLILAWIQQQGGLQAALDKLKGQGLSSQVEDWVSTGPGENASVNPEQVQNLFDDALP